MAGIGGRDTRIVFCFIFYRKEKANLVCLFLFHLFNSFFIPEFRGHCIQAGQLKIVCSMLKSGCERVKATDARCRGMTVEKMSLWQICESGGSAGKCFSRLRVPNCIACIFKLI